MTAHRQSGERSYRHKPYLAGTLYCNRCESRLVFGVSTSSRGDRHAYWFCIGGQKKRTGCDLPYLAAEQVEIAISDHWQSENMVEEVRLELQDQLLADLRDHTKPTASERDRLERRMHAVRRGRLQWADRAMDGSVPRDIAKDKQEQLAIQLAGAELQLTQLGTAEAEHETGIRLAVRLPADCGKAYREGVDATRRAYNQAWFERLYLDTDRDRIAVARAELTPIFEALQTSEIPTPVPTPDIPKGHDSMRYRVLSYVEGSNVPTLVEVWFPHHVIELATRQSYSYCLYRHIMPTFAGYRLIDILPADVREWVLNLQRNGVQPHTIRYAKTVLSAIFTTALNDQITFLHPCMGVKTPATASKRRRVITPEQFELIYASLPNRELQLFVETDVETGLRWGELVELRVKDIDWDTGVIAVSRVAGEIVARFNPDGQRFFVKQYPKDTEWRGVTLSRHMFGQLRDHVDGLTPESLLFRAPEPTETPYRRPAALPDPETLGHTEPNEQGRSYLHGTLSGYGAGKCRCRNCKDACAMYRAVRRAAGRDQPRQPRSLDTDGHIPRAWFRQEVWIPTLEKAGLGFEVRFHDLRHAHASWLLAGGADIQVVKERMGHSSVMTTQKYLHTLPNADAAAVAALDSIRKRIA